MNVARDTAGFALPFAVGVFLAVYLGNSFFGVSSATLSGIFITVCALAGRSQLHLPDPAVRVLVFAGACLCGVLSGLTGVFLSIDMPESRLETLAIGFGEKMQRAIDAIPFNSDDTGPLIKALLSGEKSSLPRELTESFRDSGASHILALSGLHLGIIYGILNKILSTFGNSPTTRRLRSLTVIAVCGFYTLATGAGPSITRAFLFILLGETARLTGRYHGLSQTLMSALIIQLTLSPLSARSIGFQLSYAAMAGIAFIYPWLNGLWPSDEAESRAGKSFGKAMKRIWDSLSMSIACQITTGPLAYMYFGTFPRHFLLTNLLALPLTGILIPCALITLCLTCLGWCPEVLVIVTEALAQAMIRALEIIATM